MYCRRLCFGKANAECVVPALCEASSLDELAVPFDNLRRPRRGNAEYELDARTVPRYPEQLQRKLEFDILIQQPMVILV